MQITIIIKAVLRHFISAFVVCITTWILTLVAYPYFNPILVGLSHIEAIRETFGLSSLLPLLFSVSAFFCMNFIVSVWLFRNYMQVYLWGGFLGIYIGAILVPSYSSQEFSEWFQSHLPGFLPLVADVLVIVGTPFLIAWLLKSLTREAQVRKDEEMRGQPLTRDK